MATFWCAAGKMRKVIQKTFKRCVRFKKQFQKEGYKQYWLFKQFS